MTLDKFRSLADRALEPFVAIAIRIGATPDAISVVAFAVAIVAAVCFGLAETRPWLYAIGGMLVFANGWLDLLDGAVARQTAVDSPAGDLLDHVLDRYADVVLIGGLAFGSDALGLGFLAVTGVVLTSYLGTQAEAVGLDRVYGGVMGRADRLALMTLAGVLAWAIPGMVVGAYGVIEILLAIFAIVGHLTAIQRFFHARRAL